MDTSTNSWRLRDNMTERFFSKGYREMPFTGDRLHVLITTFGEGETGRRIKEQIETGIKCQEMLSDIDAECSEPAVVGINWRAGGQMSDTVFVCNGEGTVPATFSRIKSDLIKSGFIPNISINGHGRP